MVAHAQEVVGDTIKVVEAEAPAMVPADTYNAAFSIRQYAAGELPRVASYPFLLAADSLHLPAFTHDGHVLVGRYPFYRYGWSTWDLHQGLNVSVGASVFAQFGKHAHGGVGFGQTISAMYAMPLTSKLSMAVGGYFNNMYWMHTPVREAGMTAVMGYRFDDHWEAYLYGQKALTGDRHVPYPLYDMGELGDRIGAAVRYNFNPSFSVEVSVGHESRPNHGSTSVFSTSPGHSYRP
jgi:hypothetical protein